MEAVMDGSVEAQVDVVALRDKDLQESRAGR